MKNTELQYNTNHLHEYQQALDIVRKLNRLIIYSKSVSELLQNSCEILVQNSFIQKVWFILLDDNEEFVEMFTSELDIAVNRNFKNNLTLPKCAQSVLAMGKKLELFENREICDYCPVYINVEDCGSVILPVLKGGKKYGILSCTIKETVYRNENIANLVDNLAEDLGVGIAYLNDLEERKFIQEKYRFLSSSSFEGIIVHRRGVVLDANERFLEMTGYSLEEGLGSNLLSYIPKLSDKRKILSNIIKEVAAPYVVTAQRKDGSTFYAELEARNVKRDNKTVRIVACRDVTSRVLSEKKLVESEEKYRSVVDNSMEGILVIQNQKIVYANPAILKITGYSESSFKGLEINEFIAAEDLDMIVQNHVKRLHGKQIPSYDFRVLNKNKEKIWVHINAKKIDWYGNDAVLCLLTDIHDRKLAEDALKISELKFRTYIEASPTAVFILNPQLKLTFANYSTSKMFGYSKEDLLKLEISQLIEPDGQISELEYFKDLCFGKKLEHKEFKYKRQDGDIITVDTEGVKISEREVIIYCREITALKKSQNDLKLANEKLIRLNSQLASNNRELELARFKSEESDRLKSAFLANMSHEIRTPMNGILGFSELLSDDSLSVEERNEYINIIQQSGDRMLSIINDLIDISKIEAGQMSTTIRRFNVCDQMESLFKFFKPEVERKDLKFELQYNDSPKSAESDEEKIYAILVNLIKNAIKYSDTGKITFGCTQKNNTIEYFVSDTGIGIEQVRLNSIFERFIQVQTDRKRVVEGAGLGLAISKAYAQLLGGNMWAESELGKGSTFYFTIPLK